MPTSPDTLSAIERGFHNVILGRAGHLVEEHGVTLPDVGAFVASGEGEAWFPVPGMYGGFRYWIEGEGEDAKLVTESWCRVVGGSGQRHEVTADEAQLVAEGFV